MLRNGQSAALGRTWPLTLLTAMLLLTSTIEKRQTGQQLHPPVIRAYIDPLAEAAPSVDQLRYEPWMLKPNGELVSGDEVRIEEVRISPSELSIALWGGIPRGEDNWVSITLRFSKDRPFEPRASATARWSGCLAEEAELAEITGHIRVQVPSNSPISPWTGNGPARIHFTLRGTSNGEAYCIHGSVFFDPALALHERR